MNHETKQVIYNGVLVDAIDFGPVIIDPCQAQQVLDAQAAIDAEIAQMGHQDMCRIWRFGDDAKGYRSEYFQGDHGDQFKARLFDHFGGFTPEISKRLGWGW